MQAAQQFRALQDQSAASAAALSASQADVQEVKAASEQLASDKDALTAQVRHAMHDSLYDPLLLYSFLESLL